MKLKNRNHYRCPFGTPDCKHDGHGWREATVEFADNCTRPGLWFLMTCLGCGRQGHFNTKGDLH